MKTKLRWTEKQREVAELVSQGKSFNEIVAAGYTKNMAFRVMNSIKGGDSPGESHFTPPPASHRRPESRKLELEPGTRTRGRAADPVAVGSLLVTTDGRVYQPARDFSPDGLWR